MSNLNKGSSEDVSYPVSIHLAKGFRGEYFLETSQKQELYVTAMFVNGSEVNEDSIEDLPRMLHTKFHFISPNYFREEFF